MYYFFCAKAIVSPFFDGGIRLKSLSYLKNSPLKTIFSFGTYCHRISYVIFLSGICAYRADFHNLRVHSGASCGCILDPLASTIVGTAFGLSSMWKASADYVAAGDRIFSPILSGSPLSSFALSVISRALFGLLIGLMYTLAKKSQNTTIFLSLLSHYLEGRYIRS